MRITPFAVTALVATLLAASGCSSDSGTEGSSSPTPVVTTAAPATTAPTGASAATVHEVRANRGNSFSPTTLTLRAGDSVKVIDTDGDAPHNFVVDGVGRSDTMNEGDTFSLRFPKAGTFEFVCTFHEALGMKGTITVT